MFLQIDETVTRFIYQIIPHITIFDFMFSFFSVTGGSIIIWLIIITFLIFFEEMRNRRFIITFFISLAATSFLVNVVLKNVFQRPRPSSLISNFEFQILNLPVTVGACPRDYSLPSGHAAIAFAAAVVLSAYDKKRRYFYYSIALLISLSRIYLYCHFFADVVVGALIGYLISYFTHSLFKRPIK